MWESTFDEEYEVSIHNVIYHMRTQILRIYIPYNEWNATVEETLKGENGKDSL